MACEPVAFSLQSSRFLDTTLAFTRSPGLWCLHGQPLCHSCSIGVPWAASGWNWEGFVPTCSLLSFPSGGLPGFLDDESHWNGLTSAGHWGYCPLLDPAGPFLTSRAPCAACVWPEEWGRIQRLALLKGNCSKYLEILALLTRVFWKLSF